MNFLLWLLLHEMVGASFAYRKFKGGPLVAFIGYELDYVSKLVGLSDPGPLLPRVSWQIGFCKSGCL